MNLIEKTILTTVSTASLVFSIVIFFTMRNEHHQTLNRFATDVQSARHRIDRLAATINEMRVAQGRLTQIVDLRNTVDALQTNMSLGSASANDAPLEQRLSAYIARASAGTKALLVNDAYADLIFTEGARIMGGAGSDPSADLARRTAVDCADVPLDGLKVIVSAGQSNAANTTPVDQIYEPRNLFYNLNIDDGKCYIARAPVLGNNGAGSSFVLPLADDLIDQGLARNVLLVPIAIGGTYIEEWRPSGGKYFSRFERAVSQLRHMGVEPSYILWHQGEGDAGPLNSGHTIGVFGSVVQNRQIEMTDELREAVKIAYIRDFLLITKSLRKMGVTAPIFPATASLCGMDDTEPTIRSAQQFLPDPALGIVAGPDTDLIDVGRRFDLCHFDLAGQEQHAVLWTATLANYEGKPDALPPPGLCSIAIFRRSAEEKYRLVWNVASGKNPVLDHDMGPLPALSGAIVLDRVLTSTPYSMTITAPDGTSARCVAMARDR